MTDSPERREWVGCGGLKAGLLLLRVQGLSEKPVQMFEDPRREGKEGGTKLLPEELRNHLPPLYAQEKNKDPIVHAKFFTPDSNWTWYVTEGSQEGDEFIFFGWVVGHEKEWGYFALSELESVRGPLGLPIERDLYFTPRPWSEVKKTDVES